MTDAERIKAIKAEPELYTALENHLGEIIGHKLFTLLVIDRSRNEAARVYSSNPSAYPVKGRKPLGELTDWGNQLIGEGRPYIGYSAEDLEAVFPDYELIATLGCASVLNVPVVLEGVVIGTVNMLHRENWYLPEHAERVAPFAELLVPDFQAWSVV